MDTTSILTIIGSYGFPIVACIAMGWYVKYTTDKNREEIAEIRNQHKEEMAQVTTALNNNTLAIQRLCDKLGDNTYDYE